MRLLLAGLFATTFTGYASAQDRVIGLLSLPEVFGAQVCAPFEPGQVPLHAAPKAGTATA